MSEWQPIETAPKDGSPIEVRFEWGPDDGGEDSAWQLAGWYWHNGSLEQGIGKGIAWRPMPPNTRNQPDKPR